jgi:hypothetical protein
MKNFINSLSRLPCPFAMTLALSVTASSAEADEGQTLGLISTDLLKQLAEMGKLMVAGAMLVGIVMLGSGLMKLKQAAESQGVQTRYSEGMWRLGVGAALIGIPALANVLTGTLSLGPTSITNATGF